MKCTLVNCLSVILVVIICSAMAAAQYQKIIEDYADYSQNSASEIKVEGNAAASESTVKMDEKGDKFISFDFTIGPKPSSVQDANHPVEELKPEQFYEAESAKLEGWTGIFADPNASGGKVVSGFGDKPYTHIGGKDHESMLFENMPACRQLIFYYANGSSQTNVYGLYVNNERITTLEFPPTGSWLSDYEPLVYNGPVQGNVELRTTADEWKVNHNQVGAIFDRVGICAAINDSGIIDISMPLKAGLIKGEDHTISFTIKSIQVPFRIELEDANGQRYKSINFRQFNCPLQVYDPNKWDRYTVIFDEFEPPVTAAIKPTISKIHFVLSHEKTYLAGTFRIGPGMVSKGWPSTPPADCPFELSKSFGGIRFTGIHKEHPAADTWYPSWAQDDVLYSCWTDGSTDGLFSRSDSWSATTGAGMLIGDSPLELQVKAIGIYTSSPKPLGSRYPCANLVYNGVWYYGTYDAFWGPFFGFRCSKDYGKTWTTSAPDANNNLFGVKVSESGAISSPILVGAPHVVDFGKNMMYSPDGKAYLVGHGASVYTPGIAKANWILGDEVYMVRVKPSPETINDLSKYEFFAGYNKENQPTWTNDIQQMKPLFTWKGYAGCVTVTYNPALKKYMMWVTTGNNIFSEFDTYLLEADQIDGHYRLVSYMQGFGRQAYFVNIPSKFIGADGKKMWMLYSGNYTVLDYSPRYSIYGITLREFTLIEQDNSGKLKVSDAKGTAVHNSLIRR